MKKIHLSRTNLLFITISYITIFGNFTFFNKINQKIDIFTLESIGFIITVYLLIFAFLAVIFSIFSAKKIIKPFLILMLFITAIIGYFSNIGVIFSNDMIANIVQGISESNTTEASELVSISLIIYLIQFLFIPYIFLFFAKIPSNQTEWKKILIYTLTAVVTFIIILIINFKYTTFVFKENGSLNLFSNPTYFIYSAIGYTKNTYFADKNEFLIIGGDAKLSKKSTNKRIGIIIVGETARADRFSINGYEKLTNPLLSKQKIINFTNNYSCGTSTAYSLPCMFSALNKNNYSPSLAKNQSNVLDIVKKSGIDVLWIENNSGCKGICDRIKTIKIKNSSFDGVILTELSKQIKNATNSALIVLHTIGSHGPRYDKRYPKKFEKFTPVCKTSPQKCTKQQINNSYDNTIFYTDYFITAVIEELKQHSAYESFVLYVSDHGESLGENGVYLHGLPYFIAPKEQIHIPMLAWFSWQNNSQTINKKTSHDNLFHSILGLFAIQTKVYNKNLDIFKK